MHVLVAGLLGLFVAWAFRKRQKESPLGVWQLVATVLAALFPYVDGLFFLVDPGFALLYRYTVTWSLLLVPFYAFLIAQGFSYALKGYEPESPYRWQRFFVPAFAAIMLTVLMGMFSENGLALLAPLWFGRASFGVIHSFDVGLFVGLIVFAILSRLLVTWKTDIARGVLVLLVFYIGVVGTFKLKATHVGARYGSAMGLQVEKIHTLPQSLSPFYWQIVVLDADQRLHETRISLKRNQPLAITPGMSPVRRAKAVYMPIHGATWRIYNRLGRANPAFVKKAWQVDVGPTLTFLSRFAVFQEVISAPQRSCAQFKDIRFEGLLERHMGQYRLCEEAGGRWKAYHAAEDGSFFLLEEIY